MADEITVESVFGIRARPVRSYVSRPQVDGAFEAALKTDHHIVIYGSSKQGKTALRQKHLDEESDCVVVRPGPRTAIEDVYQPILRSAGVTVDTFEAVKADEGTFRTHQDGVSRADPLGRRYRRRPGSGEEVLSAD